MNAPVCMDCGAPWQPGSALDPRWQGFWQCDEHAPKPVTYVTAAGPGWSGGMLAAEPMHTDTAFQCPMCGELVLAGERVNFQPYGAGRMAHVACVAAWRSGIRARAHAVRVSCGY